MEFRWNLWNIRHVAEHGISVREVEYVADHAHRPYPEMIGSGKWLVVGQSDMGRYLQVIYVDDPVGTVFVIHARELNDREKWRYRRRMR